MFIFGNAKYLSSTTFSRSLKKYINIAKLKSITPYGFRSSHASLFINLGCNSKDVAARIGDKL